MAARKTQEVDNTEVADVVEDSANVEDDILDNELDRLLADDTASLKLSDGTYVQVRPLKLKELFSAFRVITRGAALTMGALSHSILQDSSEQFSNTLIALLINAVPEADEEFAEFLRVVVDPDTPEGGWKSKEDRHAAEVHLDTILLGDPEIDDAIDILSVLIGRESKDIQRLGKKVTNAAKMFSKVAPLNQK